MLSIMHVLTVCQGGVVPWSLAVDSLRYEKEIRKYSDGDVRKKCMTTSHELLRSIHDGERVCSLHLLDAQSICEILNRYSHIVWFGNSITTQTIIGLLNLLASNLSTNTKYTYNPIFPHLNSRAEEGQQRCRCDGQYSPHTTCKRSYRELDLVNSIEKVCWDIMDESFHASSFRFKFMKVFNGVQNDLRFRSCENQDDARPHLIYVQAGNQDVAFSDTNPRHVQHDLNPREIDVAAFCQRILTPVILEYEYYFQHCNNGKTFPVHIVFSGVHARNHHPNGINETTYSLTALKALNDRLLDYVKKWYPHVHVLDFFMLTLPPTGSPDGYHYYTSTNIQKANVLVQLMAILADQ